MCKNNVIHIKNQLKQAGVMNDREHIKYRIQTFQGVQAEYYGCYDLRGAKNIQ